MVEKTKNQNSDTTRPEDSGMERSEDTNYTVTCKKCGVAYGVGQWPLCNGNPSDHGPNLQISGEITPIVYHQDPVTGQISFPGHVDDPVDSGFVRKEIKSIREYEKFRRDWNAAEREEVQGRICAEKAYHDQRIKERREQVKAILGSSRSKMFDMVQRWSDEKRERLHSRRMRGDPNCHSRIIEFNGNAQRIAPKVRD